MHTARGAAIDKLIGLELGVDDCVFKPVPPREPAARVKEVLRRSSRAATADAATLPFGHLRINGSTRVVEDRRGPLKLTAREFDLRSFLASHAGQVFTRDKLMDAMWDYEFGGDTGTVTVHMRRLREKGVVYFGSCQRVGLRTAAHNQHAPVGEQRRRVAGACQGAGVWVVQLRRRGQGARHQVVAAHSEHTAVAQAGEGVALARGAHLAGDGPAAASRVVDLGWRGAGGASRAPGKLILLAGVLGAVGAGIDDQRAGQRAGPPWFFMGVGVLVALVAGIVLGIEG